MANSDPSLPSQDEDIEIHDRIESGFYGSVYRATQKSLGRQVAVKIIKTEMNAADALAHAKPLARVSHPAIVTVHMLREIYIPDLGRSVPAIVMEWVEGDTLGKRLTKSKFTVDEAGTICDDVLGGIEHLHSNGLCHGDLHPYNVLILPTGHAKIIDIDANKELSLAKLSAVSQEGAKSSDIDYCRNVIFRTLRHSTISLSVVADNEFDLEKAASIDAIRRVVDRIIQGRAQKVPGNSSSPQSGDDWLDRAAMTQVSSEKVVALLDTQTFFDLLKLPYPESRDGVLSQLVNEGVIRPTDSKWVITNGGAILFAKKNGRLWAIRFPKGCSLHRLRRLQQTQDKDRSILHWRLCRWVRGTSELCSQCCAEKRVL